MENAKVCFHFTPETLGIAIIGRYDAKNLREKLLEYIEKQASL